MNILLSILVGLTGLSLICSSIAIFLSIKMYVRLESILGSTHKVETVSVPMSMDESDFNYDYGDDFRKHNELLKKEMPEFATYDDDFKTELDNDR